MTTQTQRMAQLLADFGDELLDLAKMEHHRAVKQFGYCPVDPDDLYQDMLLRASLVEPEAMQPNPGGYLRIIARNLATDHARKLGGMYPLPLPADEEEDVNDDDRPVDVRPTPDALIHHESPEDAYIAKEQQQELDGMASAIVGTIDNPLWQATARSYYIDGDTPAEIAEAEGVSEATVRKRLQRTRDALGPDNEADLEGYAHIEHSRPRHGQRGSATAGPQLKRITASY